MLVYSQPLAGVALPPNRPPRLQQQVLSHTADCCAPQSHDLSFQTKTISNRALNVFSNSRLVVTPRKRD